MKANESVKNYASSVRMYANYTVREIRKICKEIGPRPAGSESEKKAQEYIAEQMKTCADEVTIEPFKLAPNAFMRFITIAGVFMLLALVFSFLQIPLGGFICTFAGIVCVVMEFLMYNEFYDALFPKKTSHNVIGVKKATGETKRRIILSGHVDSSYEWTYTQYGGAPLLFACGGFAVVSLFYVCIATGLDAFNVFEDGSQVDTILQWIQLIGIPGSIFAFGFVNFRRCVEGANDNLTGTVASVAVLKFLKDNDISFENTEVVAMSAGSEESGLRGSRAYTKKHMAELKEIPTIFVGLETLRELDSINIYSRDMSGTVKMDKGVCSLLKKAGLQAGLDIAYASVYLGASDAAAVQKLGIPAATIAAMNPGPPRYYHTRRDTGDNLDLKTVEKGVEIAINSVFIFDEEGYKESYEI